MKTYRFRTAKPAEFDVISLDEARSWLNMDIPGVTFADELIKSLLKSAITYVENRINFSLGISTYKWNAGCFPRELPDTFYAAEIVSIKDTRDGVLTAIDPANYTLVRTGELSNRIDWISSYEEQRYPTYAPYEVVFTAGMAPDAIDADLKMALRVLLAAWYDKRDNTVAEKKTLADLLINNHVIGYA